MIAKVATKSGHTMCRAAGIGIDYAEGLLLEIARVIKMSQYKAIPIEEIQKLYDISRSVCYKADIVAVKQKNEAKEQIEWIITQFWKEIIQTDKVRYVCNDSPNFRYNTALDFYLEMDKNIIVVLPRSKETFSCHDAKTGAEIDLDFLSHFVYKDKEITDYTIIFKAPWKNKDLICHLKFNGKYWSIITPNKEIIIQIGLSNAWVLFRDCREIMKLLAQY